MIVTRRVQFETVCRQRGYELGPAMACVIAQDGDRWTIDETHPAYPRHRVVDANAPAVPVPTPSGPGTELKRLLASIGITSSPGCSCNQRAREMDARGPEWCEANLDTIVGWLREEASKRKLPFVDMAGRLLVKRAIRNARKAAG